MIDITGSRGPSRIGSKINIHSPEPSERVAEEGEHGDLLSSPSRRKGTNKRSPGVIALSPELINSPIGSFLEKITNGGLLEKIHS